jgi:hypothetical protein
MNIHTQYENMAGKGYRLNCGSLSTILEKGHYEEDKKKTVTHYCKKLTVKSFRRLSQTERS